MKKNLLTGLLSLGLLAGITSCGGSTPNYDKVLADADSAAWCVHGNIKLADGTENGWNGKEKELYEKSSMTAISINEAVAIDATVGAALKTKNVKHLYGSLQRSQRI